MYVSHCFCQNAGFEKSGRFYGLWAAHLFYFIFLISANCSLHFGDDS